MLARPPLQQTQLLNLRVRCGFIALLTLLFTAHAFAEAPAFTGDAVLASGSSSIVNLRAQGAVTGTAPMDVQVNSVRVGGILSSLISVVRTVLQPGAQASVCVEVQNLLGLDLTILGVEVDVTVFNADAPGGVSGRVTVQTGSGGEDISPQACADAVQLPPTANAGADQNVADSDQQPGEVVTLNGAGSIDPDGTITAYEWRNAANEQIATGATPAVRLPDGQQVVTLTVTDSSGATATDTVSITVTAPAANQLPTARAGPDQIVPDTDNQAGESSVTLDGTASVDPDGAIASYQWLLGQSTQLATGATAIVQLPDGPQTITLRVTDDDGGVATDTVVITVAAPNPAVAPVANAGGDRTIADTDATAGENVTLDGSASTDAGGTIVNYQWQSNGQDIATGATADVRLPDGENFITLIVTDNDGNTASVGVFITVAAAPLIAPVANAGPDQAIADSDANPGEDVTLDAGASTDADGAIVSYQWTLAGQPLATGVTATVRLPDGDSIVTLTVVDDDGTAATDAMQVSVAAAQVVPVLSIIPGLTPNQLSVAVALDALCPRLSNRALEQTLAAGQADLLQRCNAIRYGSSTPEQITALDEISPQDLNATRTQTINLSRSQLSNVADRLIALRGGARGLSLTGLNLQLDGESLPLHQMASAASYFLGGGASSDEKQRQKSPDEFFDERMGVWVRGNYSFGDKDDTIADHGFDSHQWGLMSGVDFRMSPTNVLGLALGYGRSEVSFNPTDQGGLNTKAVTAALYTTMYSKQGFYVDAIVNYLQSGHDSERRIVFTEGGALLDLDAVGQTDGKTMGFAFTLGYDLSFGAFTISPSVGYNYMETSIEPFREWGANGLDLAYETQNYSSGTANVGLRLTYAWKTQVGVFVPQIRGEYIREGMQDTDAFYVRFANDPFDDTPLILVQTDEPDRSYWRVAGGFSAQFRYGISGFVEYQRLEGLEFSDYADVAMGVRFETGL